MRIHTRIVPPGNSMPQRFAPFGLDVPLERESLRRGAGAGILLSRLGDMAVGGIARRKHGLLREDLKIQLGESRLFVPGSSGVFEEYGPEGESDCVAIFKYR